MKRNYFFFLFALLFLTAKAVYAQPLDWRDVYYGVTTPSFQDAIYASGTYVVIDQNAPSGGYDLAVSTDTYNWVYPTIASGTAPSSLSLAAITYGNSKFVAVGNNGNNSSTYIARSSDGINWFAENQDSSNPSPASMTGITYGLSMYVAVSSMGVGVSGWDGYIQTSPDAINWTLRYTESSNGIDKIAFSGTKFVAISGSGNYIITSTNGTTWASSTSMATTTQEDIAYGGGKFLILADGGNYLTSPDGTTWTRKYDPLLSGTAGGSHVKYLNGNFVVDGRYTSPDGVTWTSSGATQWANYTSNYVTFLHDGTRYMGFNNTNAKVSIASASTTPKIIGTPLSTPLSSTISLISNYAFADNGGSTTTALGICWGTTPAPTSNCTPISSTSTGLYIETLTGLPSKTTIYYRGYAINGKGTYYTSDSTTSPILAPVTSAAVLPFDSQATTTYTASNGLVNQILVLKGLGSPVGASPADGGTYNVGDPVGTSTVACIDNSVASSTNSSCLVPSLNNGTAYHLKIFAKDTSGNYSLGVIPTGSPVTPSPTTILANGTDTSSKTVGPATGATTTDAFTFKTTQGTDVITSVVVNFGSSNVATSTSLIEIVSDSGSTVYGSVSNPSGATTSITLSNNTLTANTTETQYKIRITPKTQSNMPLGGGTYVITPYIESWSGTNNQYATDSGGSILTIDDQAPTLPITGAQNWSLQLAAATNTWNSVTFGNGLYVAVSATTSSQSVMTSPDGVSWTMRTATSGAWSAVTYGNGLFVALSCGVNSAICNTTTGKRIMTSPDGTTWTVQSTTTNTLWQSVAYGNGKFVAVGCGGTGSSCSGTSGSHIIYSTDGVTWTTAVTDGNPYVSVIYSNGKFVALRCNTAASSCSSVTTVPISYSYDGINWTIVNGSVSPSSGRLWQSIAYGNGLYVVVSCANSSTNCSSSRPDYRIASSPDLVTWTARGASSETVMFTNVAFINGMFVAVSTTKVFTSADGITWSSTSPGNNSWQAVAGSGGKFVAVGTTNSNRAMVASTTAPYATPLYTGAYVFYTNPNDSDTNSIYVLKSTSTDVSILTDGTTYNVNDVVGSSTVACIDSTITPGAADSCNISSGLTTGTTYYLTIFSKDNYGNYSNGAALYPVTPSNTTSITTGTDPTSTTTAPGTTQYADTFTVSDAVGTDSIPSLVVNLGSSSKANLISLIEITSSNGVSVYGTSSPAAAATTSITLSTPITVNTTPTDYKIRLTFKSQASMTAVPGELTTISPYIDSFSATNNKYLNDSGATITLDNLSPILGGVGGGGGDNWTLVATTSSARMWNALGYGNGLYVAASTDGYVMTSPDGITWTDRTTPATDCWNSVAYGAGMYVIVGDCSGRIFSSPDGVTWTQQKTGAGSLRTVVYANNQFVAVGSSVSWTSPDGVNWTQHSTAAGNNWYGITYGNGVYVAVAISGTTNRAMVSSDGAAWTLGTTNTNNWESVTYGNGMFVAVAGSGTGNRVMTSTDGLSWTTRTSAADNTWRYVIYDGTNFVASAITGTGNRVMISPDGINWTIESTPQDNSWQALATDGTKIISVASTGSNRAMYSYISGSASTTPGNNQISVNYVTPSTSDTNSILVLVSTSTISATTTPTEGQTYSLGNSIGNATVGCIDTTISPSISDSCTVTSLTNGTQYYFRVFAKDNYGNYSTGASATGTPLAGTTLGTGSDPSLTYVIPGSGATNVDAFTLQATLSEVITSVSVNFSTSTVAALSLVEITSDNGSTVYGSTTTLATSTTVTLNTNTLTANGSQVQYKIRVTPQTSGGMPGSLTYPISAYIESFTGTSTHVGADTGVVTLIIDNQPPSAVTSASASVTSTNDIRITYTNPAADATSTLVLKATSATSDTPTTGATYSQGNTIGASTVLCVKTNITLGAQETCTYSSPPKGTSFYFRIFAKDQAGNYSAVTVPTGVPIDIPSPRSEAFILDTEPYTAATTTKSGATQQSGGGSGTTSSGGETSTGATTTKATSTPTQGGGGGDVGFNVVIPSYAEATKDLRPHSFFEWLFMGASSEGYASDGGQAEGCSFTLFGSCIVSSFPTFSSFLGIFW